MKETHIETIAKELNISYTQVKAVLTLLEGGGTIPFISRYRKEMTGSLDEVQIAAIRDLGASLEALEKRRESILNSLEERELLTDELKKAIMGAKTLTELEDIYLPYRPKRRTRATMAREKGLEPLASLLYEQDDRAEVFEEAQKYINSEKGVADIEEALQGARDIIAEQVNEDSEVRARMRNLFHRKAVVSAKVMRGKEEEGAKFKDYFEWNEPIDKIPSHRMLAIRRGEKELFLSLSVKPEAEDAIETMERLHLKGRGEAANQVQMAIGDCYKRLLGPSMETEVRIWAKEKADIDAIKVFAENLRHLLMAAPMGQKRVMALDPGFRTGCKVVCLDEQGQFKHFTTIYPHPPQRQEVRAEATILDLVEKYKIEAIAVGNGTAGRESEKFLQSIGLPKQVQIIMVNESGASIYSASEVAREEFPDQDLTVRGAVSIGRRLTDPLAELVKIDAKSIGVGQYQHDVDQSWLKQSLDDTVMSCVNAVGVEVNTASKQLLTYVSGLGPGLAQNIVTYRNENGPFASRKEILKVPRLGAKAFEQAAGFLRIHDSKNPLDRSAVHPESYPIVKKMAKDLGVKVEDLMTEKEFRDKLDLKDYVTESAGLPTLKDIMAELAKPGRDPREKFEAFSFDDKVNSIGDLHEGMWLPGLITNVADFGAFVDIGVHQDGLVHISQLVNRFIKHPSEVVKVQQQVKVRVVSIDIPRKRIGLSMIAEGEGRPPRQREQRSGAPKKQAQRKPQPPKEKPAARLEDSEFFRGKKQQRRK